jgi:hypothetical protein
MGMNIAQRIILTTELARPFALSFFFSMLLAFKLSSVASVSFFLYVLLCALIPCFCLGFKGSALLPLLFMRL